MSDLVEPAQLPLLNSLAGLSFYTQYLNVAPPQDFTQILQIPHRKRRPREPSQALFAPHYSVPAGSMPNN